MKTPKLFSGGGVYCVEITVPAPCVDRAIGISRRGMDNVAGLEFPFQRAGPGVDRIDISVSASEVYRFLGYNRARQVNVILVGNCLILWLESVYAFGFKAS